jgi:hypothetical protein
MLRIIGFLQSRKLKRVNNHAHQHSNIFEKHLGVRAACLACCRGNRAFLCNLMCTQSVAIATLCVHLTFYYYYRKPVRLRPLMCAHLVDTSRF